jgi:hypothetical protein
MIWHLTPAQPVGLAQYYPFNYAGSGYFDMKYTFTPILLPQEVLLEIDSVMVDDDGQGNPTGNVLASGQQYEHVAANGDTHPFTSTLSNGGFGYHNGPCTLKGTAINSPT